MRQRTKISHALCSHATPIQGRKPNMGRQEVLKKKFQSGEITTEELREYAEIKAADTKAPTSVIIFIWSKPQVVSFSEYKRFYEPLGFTYKTI